MIEIDRKKIRNWSMLGARGTYGMAVLEAAKEIDNFVVLSADLCGSSGLNRFREAYPDRFINVGIAEQNMIGIAAGIAKEGIPAFASSFAPFVTMRSCEQIRMDVGYMNTNVKVVGIGSGLSLGYLGNSHYGLEDVAIMRAIPNLVIESPADGVEIVKTVEAAAKYNGPMYIRLTGASGNPIVYNYNIDFQIGKGCLLTQGGEILIIAAGTMVYQSVKAQKILEANGIGATVIDMHTIKPLDHEIIEQNINGKKLLVTIEEHTTIGGLGAAISEFIEANNYSIRKLTIGLPDHFGKAADYNTLLEYYGLTSEKIAQKIKMIYKELN